MDELNIVESGTLTTSWSIRREAFEDPYFPDGYRYDWIIDDSRGGYTESETFFTSVEEAKADIGVRA